MRSVRWLAIPWCIPCPKPKPSMMRWPRRYAIICPNGCSGKWENGWFKFKQQRSFPMQMTSAAVRFRVLQGNEAASESQPDSVGAAGGTQLGRERRDMELDGVLADMQGAGDELVRQSLAHQFQHFALARR